MARKQFLIDRLAEAVSSPAGGAALTFEERKAADVLTAFQDRVLLSLQDDEDQGRSEDVEVGERQTLSDVIPEIAELYETELPVWKQAARK